MSCLDLPWTPQDSSRALAHVERLIAWNRGQCARFDAPALGRVGIVGGGMMGTAVAAATVAQRISVVLVESDAAVRAGLPRRIIEELARLGVESVDAMVRQLVEVTGDLARCAPCGLVLETIVESASAKRRLYGRLEPHLAAGAVLASNTSTIPIQRLASSLAAPGRFCGLHFFHPVAERPLVEVIHSGQTAESTVALAAGYAQRLGKMPLAVTDGPGFLVNRLLLPYMTEALELLCEGVTIETIEQTARAFGMAKGPFELLDEIGLDTALRGGQVLAEAFPQRIATPGPLIAMVAAGRLDRKSGSGFSAYPDGPGTPSSGVADPAITPLLARWRRTASPGGENLIADRLFLPMLLEASRLLAEGRVTHPQEVDLGVVFGLGFPRQRGGLLFWADALGAGRVMELLGRLGALGPRAEPTPPLLEMARSGGRFYPAGFSEEPAGV